jgi:hypothetical protein
MLQIQDGYELELGFLHLLQTPSQTFAAQEYNAPKPTAPTAPQMKGSVTPNFAHIQVPAM